MKRIFITLFTFLSVLNICAQKTDYPLIGAQIFIEPGQTEKDIETFFSIMKENNMQVGRIRMFGAHIIKKDGTLDFSLYDKAFEQAHKNGVKLFVTLFPPTDELTDVGGFKFPHSKKHLNEIADYIKEIILHFRDKPALYTWVLQNEPGTGGTKVSMNDLSREIFTQWKAEQKAPVYNNGFLKADFTNERFLVYYTNWYLKWIAEQVEKYHKGSNKHINPHQILDNLPEYDFLSYGEYLTSLGASMHLSWHFGYFNRSQYPLGVSIMNDITRKNAGQNPFWVTELQGGNVTASGDIPYCPTEKEIAQYLWISIAAGTEGVIFWTLNQRTAAMEAGEWGLIDYLNRPSDRLKTIARVTNVIEKNKEFFKNAQVYQSKVTLLYNSESLWTQKKNASAIKDNENEGRKASASMKSLVAAYESIATQGVTPQIESMVSYDWSEGSGKIAIIPNMVSLPSYYWDSIRTFVKTGGKLIVTGLSGYYDENMYCILMYGFPLKDCFGGSISEYKVVDSNFSMTLDQPKITLKTHLWRGIIEPQGAQILGKNNDEVIASKHSDGKGEVLWVPSLIDLGGWQSDNSGQISFYNQVCFDDAAPVRFARSIPNVLMRALKSNKQIMTVIINKNPVDVDVELAGSIASPIVIDGVGNVKGKHFNLPANEISVCIWKIE